MKKKISKKFKSNQNIEIIHPNAAGIDIGSKEHWVCVPPNITPNIRTFGSFTSDLHAIANWLKECKVKTIAMESTGVYWISLYQVLESQGFEIFLTNARHSKNVPGRTKTDRLDCQWLQKLHTFGLLSASFIPPEKIRKLKSLLKHRDNLVQLSSKFIQHMQKSLQQMNLLLHQVISDITGQTGLKILNAILNGERNPVTLAKLKNKGIKSSTNEIAKALEGDYREEHLFTLKQSLESYRFQQKQIEKCDIEIEKHLQLLDKKVNAKDNPPPSKSGRKKVLKNKPKYDARTYLYEITGIDITKIPGLDVLSIQNIIATTGLDMSKWKTEKYFTSWLSLSPNKKISGGKELSNKTRKAKNRAALSFRRAAVSLERSKSYLGAFYRRMKSRNGPPIAITATARKIAVIFYHMMKKGEEFHELGENYYMDTYKDKMLKKLKKQAEKMGFELSPVSI